MFICSSRSQTYKTPNFVKNIVVVVSYLRMCHLNFRFFVNTLQEKNFKYEKGVFF